jgi:hypothetical protein
VFSYLFQTLSFHKLGGGGGGGGGFRIVGFRRKKVRILDLVNILHGFADLINTADLSNILARIVDFACNLVRILDCDFIVEILADANLRTRPLSD